MPGGASSIGDQETDRSLGNEIDAGGPIVVTVPTMIRRDDTDGNDSIYNPHQSIQSLVEVNQSNSIKEKLFYFFFFLAAAFFFGAAFFAADFFVAVFFFVAICFLPYLRLNMTRKKEDCSSHFLIIIIF